MRPDRVNLGSSDDLGSIGVASATELRGIPSGPCELGFENWPARILAGKARY